MQVTILIAGIILGVAVFSRLLFTARRAQAIIGVRERRTGFGAGDPFHAVSIVPAVGGCAAAELIKVQRFLSEEAPSLPLEECGSTDCRCKYIHFADRRSGARDRRLGKLENAEAPESWRLRDRRVAVGRRLEDLQLA